MATLEKGERPGQLDLDGRGKEEACGRVLSATHSQEGKNKQGSMNYSQAAADAACGWRGQERALNLKSPLTRAA